MNPKQRRDHWQVFDNFRKSRESIFAPKIERVLKAQKREFIEQYKQGNSAIMLNSRPLLNVIKKLYLDAATNYGKKVIANLNAQKRGEKQLKRLSFPTYDPAATMRPMGFNQRMQRLIEAYYGVDFLNLSEGITDTTKQLLIDVLTQAAADGLGFDDIVRKLEATELSRTRSRLIARTETVTAANAGAHLAAKESGIAVKKVWIATQDDRTRDDHYRVSPAAIDVDEPFKVGIYEMLHPGVRTQPNGLPVPPSQVCNCRCVIAHEAVRDASGRVIES